MGGYATVTTPADTTLIFIVVLVLANTLKNRFGILEYGGDNVSAFACLHNSPPGNRLHPVV
jgi:hypothetical protein